MKLKILKSGSSGNCSIVTDSNGNQLVIDFGIKYDNLATKINFSKVDILYTHYHGDHYNKNTQNKLELSGIDIYGQHNLEHEKIINIKNIWKVLPILVPHGDCDNFAYIIYNTIDKKNIFWATDLTDLPNINSNKIYDLICVEINYDEETIKEREINKEIKNYGFRNHLSLQNAFSWYESLKNKPSNFIAIHLSESGNIGEKSIVRLFNNNIKVATKNMELEF